MARKNTKAARKAYRPGRIDADPMGLAMTMAAKLTPHQVQHIMALINGHMHAFRLGQGNQAAWADLGGRLNVAEALAQAGIAGDHAETIAAGQQALAAVHARAYGPTKSWTLRGPEIAALDDALWLHSVQLQHCSQGELEQARQRALRRMQQALAGNAGAGVTVLHTPPTSAAPLAGA